MEFTIRHTWDGLPLAHEPARLRLSAQHGGLGLAVSAPFFNDPPAPAGEPGQPLGGLWDYEVVEAFFLNDRTEQYLEVELCPHGQHLVLLLSGRRRVWQQGLALSFGASRAGGRWHGHAHLPWSYFPPGVNKFNAFAIHGSGDARCHEALFPVPRGQLQEGQRPDFHRLEHFQPFSFGALLGEEWEQPVSALWPPAEPACRRA